MRNTLYLFLMAGMALPAFAQREKLIGTWEHTGLLEDGGPPATSRVQLKDNGEFALSFTSSLAPEEFLGAGEGGEPADEGADPSAQIFAELLPDTLAISVTATGTWAADAQTLQLDATASQVRLNGLDPQEFFIQIAKEMARRMADAFEIAEADYPAFEQQMVENVLSGAGEEFDKFPSDDLDLTGSYVLTDGVLYITDEEGETTDWHSSTLSAVEALSWGQLKAAAF